MNHHKLDVVLVTASTLFSILYCSQWLEMSAIKDWVNDIFMTEDWSSSSRCMPPITWPALTLNRPAGLWRTFAKILSHLHYSHVDDWRVHTVTCRKNTNKQHGIHSVIRVPTGFLALWQSLYIVWRFQELFTLKHLSVRIFLKKTETVLDNQQQASSAS